MNQEYYFEKNKELWNAKTPVHIGSEFYDLQSFEAGETSLNEIELAGVGEVEGKTLLHLQCHFGMDTISWARMGAKVAGLDFSEAAIEQAQGLAESLAPEAKFVCCNVFDTRKFVAEKFDIVFTSYGTIGWLPDLKPWAKAISESLNEGGFFYIADFHPFVWMLDDNFKGIYYNYFPTPANEPIISEQEGTYANREANINLIEFGWNHSISEIITVLLEEGLEIESFEEFDYSPYKCFPDMKKVGEKRFVFESFEHKIPYVYALKARKKA
jgi:SAM-dependent methyltransferase